ncbi:MAG: hypothetical protein II266_04760 [Clostridia bacterium]|nr:hypothetical protein [Acidaminococcaceae bacterium]MBQ2433718.1 hypothetical protein [Clostridia bacterium]
MNENEAMQTMAEGIWQYLKPKIERMTARNVSYFRATVTAAAADGKIAVRKPRENKDILLPYVTSAAGLAVGDQCTVLVFGSASNAFIVGDGTLSGL